jgi:NitT/TauT family transport system substrate-binding protein
VRRIAHLACAFALTLLASPAAAQQPALTVIHVGGVYNDDMTPVFWGVKSGLFRREGLDVQISNASNGAAMTAAVLAGTFEFGKSSLLAAVNAHLRGLPLAVVASGSIYDSKAPFTQLCVAIDSSDATGKDFEGKVSGAPSLNDLNQLVISAWVDKHGGDASTLKFVELPNSTAPGAIAQHRVEAAILAEPILTNAVTTKTVKVLADAYDAIAPQFAFASYFTSADYAKAHPEIVAKFVKVIYEAAAYANKHHAETAPVMADATKIPLATYEHMNRVDGATALNPALFQPIIDAAAKYKMIAHGFPARDMLSYAPGLK